MLSGKSTVQVLSDLDKRLEIRHKPARQIATMRAEMFEAMMAVSYAALVAALAAFIWQGSVTPALAQAVISEPGYCAQFYPSANCQNEGPGNPYTDPNWRRDGGGWGAGQWSNGETPGVADGRQHGTPRQHHHAM
jgi:hypothetical protein